VPRHQQFLPIVLIALAVLILAPIAAFWATAAVVSDPLQSAEICHGFANPASGQSPDPAGRGELANASREHADVRNADHRHHQSRRDLGWVGNYFQVEALIPINRQSGSNVGVIAQLHLYLDDIDPRGIGKPLFGAPVQPASPFVR
jgi:hypothetical protein